MPSPIAHSASGYVISRLLLKENVKVSQLLYGVVMANAADLDFIPQILTGVKYHHGLTHSVVFCVGISVCVAVVGHYLIQHRMKQLFVLTFLLYASHLLLDFFTDGGDGIQLLWPFDARYFRSAIPLFPGTHWSEPLLQHPGHWLFVVYELIYAALLIGIEWRVRVRHRQGKWHNKF
jgi:inner membrane protein